MNITYTYRHTDSSEALEAKVKTHLDKISRYVPESVDVHCIFSVEGYRHTVELNTRGSHLDIAAHDTQDDMYKALDGALSRLEAQARKHKEKVKGH